MGSHGINFYGQWQEVVVWDPEKSKKKGCIHKVMISAFQRGQMELEGKKIKKVYKAGKFANFQERKGGSVWQECQEYEVNARNKISNVIQGNLHLRGRKLHTKPASETNFKLSSYFISLAY